MFIETTKAKSILPDTKVELEIEFGLLLELIQKYLEYYNTPKQAIRSAIDGGNTLLTIDSINKMKRIDPELEKEVENSLSGWTCAFYDCCHLMKQVWSKIEKKN